MLFLNQTELAGYSLTAEAHLRRFIGREVEYIAKDGKKKAAKIDTVELSVEKHDGVLVLKGTILMYGNEMGVNIDGKTLKEIE